jgi:transposase
VARRRHELTDEEWERVAHLVPRGAGRPSTGGNRNFVNAVIWIAKTGAPWRDLPERYGPWKTIYNRFRRWSQKQIWEDIFREVAEHYEDVAGMIDATIVRAHQDASGGAGGPKKTQ